jgi:hypothetical protein
LEFVPSCILEKLKYENIIVRINRIIIIVKQNFHKKFETDILILEPNLFFCLNLYL